jgi:hypothetical protein
MFDIETMAESFSNTPAVLVYVHECGGNNDEKLRHSFLESVGGQVEVQRECHKKPLIVNARPLCQMKLTKCLLP